MFHLSPQTYLDLWLESSYHMSISSFHQRPQYQLHDDNTHCGSSLQSLRNIFSWRNFNLEPDHFSSQSVPHRNRINHPRLRTTLLKPSYWLHHPENQYRRPHTLQIVHIVRPLCLAFSTSIRPLRGLMHDGSSHAALRSHFSFLMLGLHVPTHLPSYFPTSLCHSH